MELILLLFVFFFGAMIGSFLGVVVDRLPQNKGIIKGRSQCDYCQHKLSPLDLVPIFSFLLLGGKCRYCHRKLSWYYPLIEIVTGALFVTTFIFVGQGFMNYELSSLTYLLGTIYYLFIVSTLVVIFFVDLKYGIIPFPLVVAAVIISFVYYFFFASALLFSSLFAAVGAFLFFLTLFLLTKGRGMGFGDVIYAIFMGYLLGFPKIILGLYIAFISGAIISLVLIALKRKKLKGSTIPFGPFLVLGTIVSLFWGDTLVRLTFNVLQFTIK